MIRPQPLQFQRQKSMRNIDSNHFFQHQRKKYKPSHANLHSLHSIDTKRSSINLNKVKLHQRRRQLSIPVNNSKHIFTQRPDTTDITSKKNLEKGQFQDLVHQKYSERKIVPLYVRPKYERIQTLGDEKGEDREKKIKNCIQVMCGVLEEIKHQKGNKKVSRSKIIDEFPNAPKEGEDRALTKFESYVKSITKLKESNKAIIIKKCRSKSIINNENIHSSNLSNGKSLIAKESTKGMMIQKTNGLQVTHKRSNTTIIEQIQQSKIKGLQEISCSSIGKANQSSFVSQFSNKSFMKNLFQNQPKIEEKEAELRKMSKIKNSKEIKQMFPVGFF